MMACAFCMLTFDRLPVGSNFERYLPRDKLSETIFSLRSERRICHRSIERGAYEMLTSCEDKAANISAFNKYFCVLEKFKILK